MKRIVFRKLGRRIFAFACIGLGIVAVKLYQQHEQGTGTRFLVQVPAVRESVTGDRDLTRYDYGGEIKGCFTDPHSYRLEERSEREIKDEIKRCFAATLEARKFILAHWKSKSIGYILITATDSEFYLSRYIFIEPDDAGLWRIVIRHRVPYNYPSFNSEINIALAYELKIRPKMSSDVDTPGTSLLVFEDKNGKEVYSL